MENDKIRKTTSPPPNRNPSAMTKDERDARQEQILKEPYNYILQVPGKGVRLKLSQAFNYWMKIPEDKLEIIAEVTQMLHNASLLIDDIEDNSKLRRGIPVAHSIYGVAHTINAANYIYFQGLQKVLSLKHPETTTIFTEQLILLHQGQGMDIWWRDNFVCPTEDEYKEMVLKKTGGLFGLAIRLMQLFSEDKRNFKPLTDTLGLYFQIRDDYANLQSKQYTANKSYCEDLTEGKFSYPIIHGIHSNPDSQQVLSILRKRTEDCDIKKYCVEHLEKCGSFAYTKEVLLELESRARDQIKELDGNPFLSTMIEELSKLIREPDQ